jgi:hypothetical protein
MLNNTSAGASGRDVTTVTTVFLAEYSIKIYQNEIRHQEASLSYRQNGCFSGKVS